MVQVGRDHGKTWLMIKLFARWLLEVGQVIVIATKAKRDEIYHSVLAILKSKEVRQDYGDLINRHTMTKGEIWFVPERSPPVGPNFQVHSSDGYITGLHFSEEGWIHYEDIVQEMKVDSAAERRVRWWYKRVARYIRSLDTKATATATRKDIDDLYGWLEREHYWPINLKKALTIVDGRLPRPDEVEADHRREVLLEWPDVGTYEILNCPNWPIERVLYDFIFHAKDASAELNNNPLPLEGNYFSESDLIKVSRYTDHDAIPKYIMVDPAFGASGSETAILVVMIYLEKIVVIDGYIGHASADDKIDYILEFNEKHDPDEIYIENNFNQFTRELSRHNPLSELRGLIPFNSKDTNKKQRIAHLEYPAKKHEIEIYISFPFMDKFDREWLTFSDELSKREIKERYNALDALAMAYKRLNRFMDDQASNRRNRSWSVL